MQGEGGGGGDSCEMLCCSWSKIFIPRNFWTERSGVSLDQATWSAPKSNIVIADVAVTISADDISCHQRYYFLSSTLP